MAQLRIPTDPETGCKSFDPVALQSCRQAFFLKQQNELIRQQNELSNKAEVGENQTNETVAQQPISQGRFSDYFIGSLISYSIIATVLLIYLIVKLKKRHLLKINL